MDTIQHSAHGYLLGRLLRLPNWACLSSALLGAMPDIVGWVEKIIRVDFTVWNWYLWSHSLNGLADSWKYLLLPWAIHILNDRYTHGEGTRWWIWDERLWIEILGWGITLALFRLIRKQSPTTENQSTASR